MQGFRTGLLQWYAQHRRDLPWRRTSHPYAVLVSEIMLQQTRVAAAIPFYERFIAQFPDVQSLASAPEADLLAAWAGLGYYYRARNLQKAARLIASSGLFPTTYEGILALPGVGQYTAAAVSSICFNLPYAVVDGNAYRVLSRLLNDPMNIAASGARKHFTARAQELLDREAPGSYNQAVMELGATVCLPKNPQCLVCPVSAMCRARKHGVQNQLPVKVVAKRSHQEARSVFWIEKDDRLLLWRRPDAARLMPGFYELPEQEQLPSFVPAGELGSFRHSITFHDYSFTVVIGSVPSNIGDCCWVSRAQLATLPLSTILKKAMKTASEQLRSVAKAADSR